jgi:hypothetical protein
MYATACIGTLFFVGLFVEFMKNYDAKIEAQRLRGGGGGLGIVSGDGKKGAMAAIQNAFNRETESRPF